MGAGAGSARIRRATSHPRSESWLKPPTRALDILERRRDDIERLAKILLEKETLRADEQPQAAVAEAA